MGNSWPSKPAYMSDDFKDHYHAVSGWAEVIDFFGNKTQCVSQPRASVFISSGVDVHRIPIGIEGAVGSQMVAQLLTGFIEIEDSTGVKILLRGKGSPHPQPKSEEQSSLSIVVRTKANGGGGLEIAVPLVRKLLRKVLDSGA